MHQPEYSWLAVRSRARCAGSGLSLRKYCVLHVSQSVHSSLVAVNHVPHLEFATPHALGKVSNPVQQTNRVPTDVVAHRCQLAVIRARNAGVELEVQDLADPIPESDVTTHITEYMCTRYQLSD